MPFYKISQLPEKDSADKQDIIEVSVKTGENTYESKSVSVEQIADATITQFEYESLTTTQKTIVGAINDIDSGHTSVEVTPIKLDGTNIADITVNGNVNDIFGNNVVANPDEQSTETLLTLKLDDKVYSTRKKFVYGFHIDSSESDPTACVSYLKDAIGMTPAYMDYVTGKFNYGSWRDIWFIKYCKPCIVNKTGTVTTYLNPNDYTKDLDGNTVVINSSLPSGSNVMIEFPKIWIKIVPDEGSTTSASIYVSEFQADEDFTDFPYKNVYGTLNDKLYLQAYNASGTTALLRSVSDAQYCKNSTFEEEYAGWLANGQYCHMTTLSETMLVNILLILISKSLDTQTKFGQGLHTGGDSESNLMFRTGVHNDKGLFYGTNSGSINPFSNAVKVFGIENWWGFNERRICGYIVDGTTTKYKLCFGKADGTTVDYYNATGEGYLSIPSIPTEISGNQFDYIISYSFVNNVMLPNASSASGSSSTYYCDALTDYSKGTGTRAGLIGGNSTKGSECGAFYNNLQLADYPSYRDYPMSEIVDLTYALQADAHSLKVGITAKQGGSGIPSPDNVCPISGWTGANVIVTDTISDTPKIFTLSPKQEGSGTPYVSKNLYNYETDVTGKYLTVDGVTSTQVSGWGISDYISIQQDTTYTASGLSKGGSGTYICLYDSEQTFTRSILIVANQNLTFTSESNEYYVRLSVRRVQDEYNTTAQFEQGSTPTPYTPYSNIRPILPAVTITRDDSSTLDIYGGTLDISTGKLSSNYVCENITSADIEVGGATNYSSYRAGAYGGIVNNSAFSNILKKITGSPSAGAIKEGDVYAYNSSGYNEARVSFCFVGCKGANASETFANNKAYIDELNQRGIDFQVCYQITNPVIYDLSPSEVYQVLNALQIGNVYNASWESEAGEVYGGVVDVVKGELAVTDMPVNLGSLTWTYLTDYNRMVATVTNAKETQYACTLKFLCDCYNCLYNGEPISDVPNLSIYTETNNHVVSVCVHDSDYTDADVFKTAMNGHYISIPVETPVSYILTPVQVQTLLGTNVIYADAGKVSIRYKIDPSQRI